MIHGLAGSQPGLMVIAQQLVQKVQTLRTDQLLVLTVDEALPPLTRVSGRGELVKSSCVRLDSGVGFTKCPKQVQKTTH